MKNALVVVLASSLMLTNCSSQNSSSVQPLPRTAMSEGTGATASNECRFVTSSASPQTIFIGDAAGISATNAWAVGADLTARKGAALQFNGTSWTETFLPIPTGRDDASPIAVSMRAANDVWAVGVSHKFSDNSTYPLIEHFNGTRWSIIPGDPSLGAGHQLIAVSADAANDAWTEAATISNGVSQVALERFNGVKWSVVPSSMVQSLGSAGLLALSPTNVWFPFNNGTLSKVGTIEVGIWNGSSFRFATLPWLGTQKPFFPAGIDGTAATDVWIVGTLQAPPSQGFTGTYDAHFNGSHFSTFLNQATQVSPVAVIDFRTNYALMIDSTDRVLEFNGLDRWHYVPASLPSSTEESPSVHRVLGTTGFWEAFHVTHEVGQAGFVQCPANPY